MKVKEKEMQSNNATLTQRIKDTDDEKLKFKEEAEKNDAKQKVQLKEMENTNTNLNSEKVNITAKFNDKVTEVEELKNTIAALRLALETIATLKSLNTDLKREVIAKGMELEESSNDEGDDGVDSSD